MMERAKLALAGLRWTLGLVVLWQSYRLMRHTLPQIQGAAPGPLAWIHVVLGSVEILAAILFLLPVTRVAGGYGLLLTFVVAAVMNVLHGSFDVSGLVLYGMATLVCLTNTRTGEPQ